jgi:hypothetical protein
MELLILDYTEEALPERDPFYELPGDYEGVEESECTMSLSDAAHWDKMVEQRPMLQCLRAS